LSTLTKILVVLLSLLSIFLCGMMVTFVGSSKNYKSLYDEQTQLARYTQAELVKKDEFFNAQAGKYKEAEAALQQNILSLEAEKNKLVADLRKAERLSIQYQEQADSWKGVMTGFEQSVRSLQASLQQTQQQLDTARSQGIEDRKELNQITADLYAKIVQLQSLEAERRRLLEQKTDLEKQLGSLGTAVPVPSRPVTPQPGVATPAATSTVAAPDIKGTVMGVSESLVHLSIGSADGVRENMLLHVTRGDEFHCDLMVTNVDINQSAGVLQLVKQRPQIGDTASTQL